MDHSIIQLSGTMCDDSFFLQSNSSPFDDTLAIDTSIQDYPQHKASRSSTSLDEFELNEAIVDVLENIIEKAEQSEPNVEPESVPIIEETQTISFKRDSIPSIKTDDANTFRIPDIPPIKNIFSTKAYHCMDQSTLIISNPDECLYDENDESEYYPCSKRLVNESIMSFDDPSIISNKKICDNDGEITFKNDYSLFEETADTSVNIPAAELSLMKAFAPDSQEAHCPLEEKSLSEMVNADVSCSFSKIFDLNEKKNVIDLNSLNQSQNCSCAGLDASGINSINSSYGGDQTSSFYISLNNKFECLDDIIDEQSFEACLKDHDQEMRFCESPTEFSQTQQNLPPISEPVRESISNSSSSQNQIILLDNALILQQEKYDLLLKIDDLQKMISCFESNQIQLRKKLEESEESYKIHLNVMTAEIERQKNQKIEAIQEKNALLLEIDNLRKNITHIESRKAQNEKELVDIKNLIEIQSKDIENYRLSAIESEQKFKSIRSEYEAKINSLILMNSEKDEAIEIVNFSNKKLKRIEIEHSKKIEALKEQILLMERQLTTEMALRTRLSDTTRQMEKIKEEGSKTQALLQEELKKLRKIQKIKEMEISAYVDERRSFEQFKESSGKNEELKSYNDKFAQNEVIVKKLINELSALIDKVRTNNEFAENLNQKNVGKLLQILRDKLRKLSYSQTLN